MVSSSVGVADGDEATPTVGVIVVFGEGLGVEVATGFFPFGVAEGVAVGLTGAGVGV